MDRQRKYCHCRRHCPEGNLVSYRTFARHKRQERLDREAGNDDFDADDEESDGYVSPVFEHLLPIATPVVSPSPSPRPAVYLRERRSTSTMGSGTDSRTSSTRHHSESVPTDRDAEHGSQEQCSQGDQFEPEGSQGDQPFGSEGSIPRPDSAQSTTRSRSSTNESTTFDDIEEAIFSNFDIEDLLFSANIEVEPWLRLGIVLLRWKSRKNISTHAFDELRHDLAGCLGIKLPRPSSILRHLQEIVGIYPVKFDCCVNGCLAYVGRYRRSKKCAVCGEKRYQRDQAGDEDVPDVDLEDSDLSDGATYDDDFDENHAVRYVCLVTCCRRLRD
jgi:hypothetical protein